MNSYTFPDLPHLTSNIMIPMRDGIRLACDIYRPAQNGSPVDIPFPVILERTPYSKSLPSRSEISTKAPDRPKSRAEVAAYFVRHGYVVVYQDCRGRYNSEGVFEKYLSEAEDGYDTCEWILDQPWCDGQIGTMGLSYAAHTQVALASLGAPGIAAMVVDSGGFANAYQGGIRQGGAFELKQATWAYRNALESPEIMSNPELKTALEGVDLAQWFKQMPWRPGHSPLALAPDYEAYLFEQWQHGQFDAYWQQPGIYAQGYYQDFPDCPQLHLSSWYDAYSRTATDNYQGLSQIKKNPIHLILGPWTHGNRSRTYAGDVDFGPAAALDGNLAEDFLDLRLRFFNRYLKAGPALPATRSDRTGDETMDDGSGVNAGTIVQKQTKVCSTKLFSEGEQTAPVRIFVMGGGSGRKTTTGRLDHGGRWRTAQDWPLPETVFTPYYFHHDRSLGPEEPQASQPPLAYDYDPANPVPSIGGTLTSGGPIMVDGAFDQRETPQIFGAMPPYHPLAERPDILVFQTPPLVEPLEVSGPITVRLWIASDCPDTDFTVKLVDVYPPNPDYPEGYAVNITDGILRVRYRDSWERPSLMEAGQIYPIKIEPFPTSNLFQPGHRLRVDIASSNFPHFDLNFNTGEAEGQATYSRVAHNQVFVDQARPSHIVLPLIPK